MHPRTLSLLLVSLGCSTSPAPASQSPTASGVDGVDPAATASTPIAVDVGGTSAVLPRAVTSFGAAVHGDALFVLGGYSGPPHDYSADGQTGDLFRMDLATGAWTQLGAVAPAQSIALVTSDAGLIRIGGMQARNAKGKPADLHSMRDVARFDPATRTWSKLPDLPAPRSSHDAAILGTTIYVAGGWTLAGKAKPTWSTTLLTLDTSDADGGWTAVDAPFRRRALGMAVVGGKIAALGGMTDDRELSSSLDLYDPAAGTWSRGPDFPGVGFGVAMVAHGDTLYASGPDGVLYRWRAGDESWTPAANLAFPRFFHRLVATGDDVLVVGGIRAAKSGGRVRPIERLSVASERKPSLLAYSLPSPMPTKNRQGIAVVGDSVVAFGGNKSLGQHDFGPEFFADAGFELDLVSMRWSEVASYPAKRQTMSTLVAPWGDVVSVGGFGHDGEVARSHAEVYAYAPGKDQWRTIGRLPGLGRTQFAMTTHDDTLWIFGGLDYDPGRKKKDQFRHETKVLSAPLNRDKLEFKNAGVELREPRRAFGGAQLGDRFLLVGGMKENFELVDSCDAWSFATKQWESIPCPTRPRLSPQMVTLGERVYLAAGSSKRPDGEKGLEPNRALEVFDPVANAWSVVLDELPIEPKHMRMATYGNRLLLWSTHNDKGKLDVLLVDPGAPVVVPPRSGPHG